MGNRGKKIGRKPAAVSCGAESRGGGLRAAQRGGWAEAGAGRSGEGCCLDLHTGWKRPAGVSSLTHLGYPGPGRLEWLTSSWLLLEITVEPPKGMVKPIVNLLISIFFKGHQTLRKTLDGFKAQAPRLPEFVVWPVSVFPGFN